MDIEQITILFNASNSFLIISEKIAFVNIILFVK